MFITFCADFKPFFTGYIAEMVKNDCAFYGPLLFVEKKDALENKNVKNERCGENFLFIIIRICSS